MNALRRGLQGLILVLGALGAFFWARARGAGAGSIDSADSGGVLEGAPALIAVDQGRRRALEQAPGAHDPARTAAVLANNEAALLLEQGELARALALFETCHAAYPEDVVFTRNLAEALARLARSHYQERRLELCVAELERALALAPEREDADVLRTVLERWRKEAELALGETTDSSRYFELTYDAQRGDVLHRSAEVLARLEGSYGVLRDWFGVDPIVDGGREPIRVVLHATHAFDELTGLGDWAAGAFDGTVRISVDDLERERERWPRIARHELCHAFLREIGGPDVPGWLNEGLAQWLEAEGALERAARARASLADGVLFPIERLEGSLASWQDQAEIARAYAQSLALVAHLAQNYGESVLRAMVAGCARGESPAVSFEAATGVPFSFVLADLPNYLR